MKILKTLVALSLLAGCFAAVQAQTQSKDTKQQPAPTDSKAKSTDAKSASATPATPAAHAAKAQFPITVKKINEQVVLYTLYRGSYDQIGPAIGQLFGLAAQKQIQPMGNVYLTFLNNPKIVAPAHWLTEIRIPVSPQALNAAGTLGPMTDVKKLPAMDVAAAVKPAGMADPSPIYDALAKWIQDNKYSPLDGPMEYYPPNAMGPYEQMQTEIMLPIEKSAATAPTTPGTPKVQKN
jgi:effector-binding domain-containing protein